MKKLLTTFTIILVVLFAGCKKDDYVEVIGVCPLVISTDPVPGAISVPYNKTITATFNEKMDWKTITESSFTLQQGTALIPGIVSYIDSDSTASFVPTNLLLPFTTYKATVKNTVKDKRAIPMQLDYTWTFTTMPLVTTLSNPVFGGFTAGCGPYPVGATVTVTAIPSVGYVFVNWTENGAPVSPSSSYTFTMPAGNRTLTANFTLIVLGNFAISLSSNPPAGGSTSGAGSFTQNSLQTVIATPNTGYTFANWTEGGLEVSRSATFQLAPLTSNRTLVANFLINTYTLTVRATNGGTVAKNPNQTSYNYGSTVLVTPTADTGYTFTGWTGNASGSANPLSVLMDADKDITANFKINTYTLTVISAHGTVSKVPDQLTYTYNYGTSVVLTVTNVDEGYTFTSWSGDATGTNPSVTVIMTSNKIITANYSAIVYTVAVSTNPSTLLNQPTGGGTFNSGALVTVNAATNAGFTFTNWTEGVNIVSKNANYQFNITGNRILVANYTAGVSSYTVTVSTNPSTLLNQPTGGGTFNSAASVTVTAVANTGYTFTNWTEGVNIVSTNANYQFNITGNRILVANYTANGIPPTGPLAIDLGCAAPFAILAGSTITNTGPSIITGDVGLSPGSALIGFPPGTIIGTPQITTPIAAAAKLCLTTAFIDGQSRSLNAISLPGQLGGLTLAPGLYSNSSTSGISGTGANGILTLDAQGNANAVWIFQMGSTLKTDPATSIVLAGNAQAKNIFWIVGTSATLGTTSVFYGNILADQSITLNTGAILYGRALTRIAAVTLDDNVVTKPQ